MGTRCWSGGGRGALSWPKQDRGCKQTLACRLIAMALATLSKAIGPHHGLGLREDERDNAGAALAEESVTSPRPAKRPFGDEVCTMDVGAWGRWMAPRGF